MFLTFQDDKWTQSPHGIPFTFADSLDLEQIPAPPVVDARMVSLNFKNGVFTIKFIETQREDDRLPYDVPVFYEWRFNKWKRLT